MDSSCVRINICVAETRGGGRGEKERQFPRSQFPLLRKINCSSGRTKEIKRRRRQTNEDGTQRDHRRYVLTDSFVPPNFMLRVTPSLLLLPSLVALITGLSFKGEPRRGWRMAKRNRGKKRISRESFSERRASEGQPSHVGKGGIISSCDEIFPVNSLVAYP